MPPLIRRQGLEVDVDLPEPFQTATSTTRPVTDSDEPTRTTTRRNDATTNTAPTRKTTERTITTTARTTGSISKTTGTSSTTTLSSQTSVTSTTSSSTSSGVSTAMTTRTGSLASESMIWPNSFPPEFPIETHDAVRIHSGGRGYLFLENNELLDSVLIFVSFFLTSLVLTILLIKTTHVMSRRRGAKVDQMVGEDMKWAERREVLERKIIYEGSSRPKGRGRGHGTEAQIGWRELSERERLKRHQQ